MVFITKKAMKKRIFKYTLDRKMESVLDLPKGTQVLSAQFQEDDICIWALVTEGAETYKCRVVVLLTGQEADKVEGLVYLATLQNKGFVFHVFIDELSHGSIA